MATREIPPLDRLTLEDPTSAAWYLAGMIDGEGHVSAPSADRTQVVVANTDIALIEATEQALRTLSIPFSRGGPFKRGKKHHKHIHVISLGFRATQMVARLVPVKSPDKVERLQFWLKQERKIIFLDEHPLEEVSRLYLKEMLSTEQIARQYRVEDETIRRWLHHAGVKMRSGSEATTISWRNGHRRCVRSPEQFARSKSLYQSGLSLADVGREMNFSSETVRRLLVDGGVLIRSQQEAVSTSNRRRNRAA